MRAVRYLLFSLLMFAFAAAAQNPSATSKAWASMVTIRGTGQGGQPVAGSGFLVASNGTIITNLHLVAGLENMTVEISTGEIFDSVSLVARDSRRDLAIIRIPGFDLPFMALGNSNQLQTGEAVMLVAAAKEPIATGTIRNIFQSEGSRFIETSAPPQATGAGGMLMNANGEAIGVLGSINTRGETAVAVPINYARGMLEQAAVSMPRTAAVAKMTPEAQPVPTPARSAPAEPSSRAIPPTASPAASAEAAKPARTATPQPAPPAPSPVPRTQSRQSEPSQVAEAAPPPRPVSPKPRKKELKEERTPDFARAAMRIRKIFIASLGEGDGPDMLRDKIVHNLEQNHFVIVDRADAADAVLSGSGNWSNLRVKRFRAQLVASGDRVLWSGEVSSGGWVRSASSSVADKLVDKLMNALAFPAEEQ